MIQTMAPELAGRVRINPFGIDVPSESDHTREEPGTVVFVGGFGHRPNVDAALWLGLEIMPLLRALQPGVRLIIVGDNPTKAIQSLASEDIIVTGRVSAVEPFLERAAVVLAPLRAGGGMRVKVLQAMALGKAVVTTSVGAEGLEIAGCELPLSIAIDTEEFARATTILLRSDEMRRAMGRRARAYVMQHFSWSAYGRRMEEMYTELQPMGSVKSRQGC
jgi:glycosyltransferase involved in cell wall biosynthesis